MTSPALALRLVLCALAGAGAYDGGARPDRDTATLESLQRAVRHFVAEFEAEPSELDDDDRALTPERMARERMLSSRIEGLALSRAALGRDGSVHGVGLFATRDIAEGELITCYPGDALIYQPTEGIIFGGHVPEALADPDAVEDEWLDYTLSEDEAYAVVGIPALDDDAAYAGHFCNDGARLVDGDVDGYELASAAARNAKHVDLDGLHMVTVATRRISRGEEVLVTYGEDFWVEHGRREHIRREEARLAGAWSDVRAGGVA